MAVLIARTGPDQTRLDQRENAADHLSSASINNHIIFKLLPTSTAVRALIQSGSTTGIAHVYIL